MSNAAKFRKKAAEHESQKEFDKAIGNYARAIEAGDLAGEEVDVALLNKVGDLTLRLGRVPEAVASYERAVEHYTSVGLFNNAIALCNKILRHAPGRVGIYLTLGRVCARKGMRGDATRNFLEYASRMQKEGRNEEAMTSLSEVASIMPELTEVRRLVEEHAARVGITLPSAVDATVAQEQAKGSADSLVFLDIDYDAAVALTPPIGAASIAFDAAPRANGATRPPAATSTPSRSSSLDDLLIFDPNDAEDDALFAEPLDGFEANSPEVSPSDASVEAPSLIDAAMEADSLAHHAAPSMPEGLTDALGFEPAADVHPTAAEVLEGLVSESDEVLLLDGDGVLESTPETLASAEETSDSAGQDVVWLYVSHDDLTSDVSIDDAMSAELEAVSHAGLEELSERLELRDAVEQQPSASPLEFLDLDAMEAMEESSGDAEPDGPADHTTPIAAEIVVEAIPYTPHVGHPDATSDVTDDGPDVTAASVDLADELPDVVDAIDAAMDLADELPDVVDAIDAPVDLSDELPDVVDAIDARVDLADESLLYVFDAPIDLADESPDVVDAPVDLSDESPDVVDAPIDLADELPVVIDTVVEEELTDDQPFEDLVVADTQSVEPSGQYATVDDDASDAEPPTAPAIAAAVHEPAPSLTEQVAERWRTSLPRLNPHDFILPGELPPIVIPDSLLPAHVSLFATPSSDVVPIDVTIDEPSDSDHQGHPTSLNNSTDLTDAAGVELTGDSGNGLAHERVDDLADIADELDADLVDLADDYADDVAEYSTDLAHTTSDTSADTTAHTTAHTTADTTAHTTADTADAAPAATDPEAVDLDALLTPDAPTVVVNVGLVRCERLREEADQHPGDWARRRRLAEALLEAGELDAGLTELATTSLGLEVQGALDEAARVTDDMIRAAPDNIGFHQKRVELAVRLGDRGRLRESYLDLADALVRTGLSARAESVYVRVLELDPWDDRARIALGNAAPPPPARPHAATKADDGYVNLADWLSDDSEAPDTRMRLKEPTVTGDEDADFERLLQHFREGVSRSLGDDDYESHYDLGVAYKEMGLLDDAIAEFQRALRSPTHRLPAYEALGQCFLEQGSFPVAVTVLSRALHEPGLNDEQRVGVLYLLGYACEALQRRDEARSYFQRVYATDIQFRDVAERLADLDRVA